MWTIFLVGLLIGLVFASIIFNVVQSAVDTTVVCFAEAPVDFQRNYPDLFDQMSSAWLKVYPGLWSGEEQVSGSESRSSITEQVTGQFATHCSSTFSKRVNTTNGIFSPFAAASAGR